MIPSCDGLDVDRIYFQSWFFPHFTTQLQDNSVKQTNHGGPHVSRILPQAPLFHATYTLRDPGQCFPF